MESSGDVTLKGLQELQEQILRLSKTLEDYYNTTRTLVQLTGQTWQDPQYDKFVNYFRSQQDTIRQISEDYRTWATKYLQKEIENVADFNNTTIP